MKFAHQHAAKLWSKTRWANMSPGKDLHLSMNNTNECGVIPEASGDSSTSQISRTMVEATGKMDAHAARHSKCNFVYAVAGTICGQMRHLLDLYSEGLGRAAPGTLNVYGRAPLWTSSCERPFRRRSSSRPGKSRPRFIPQSSQKWAGN